MRNPFALFSLLLVSTAVAAAGCDDKSKPTDKPITASTDTPPSASASSSAAAVATIKASASPTDTAAPASASASAAPATSNTATVANAKKDGGASANGSSGGSAAALKPASKRVTGKNFALDLASPGCKAGEECAMTIKLSASGDYHINKEYPYKFVASPQPNVAFLGKGDANTFGRASGDFVEQGEKAALLTVRFKPSSAGEAKVSGTYKMSVCSAENCQIEQETVDLSIPVL